MLPALTRPRKCRTISTTSVHAVKMLVYLQIGLRTGRLSMTDPGFALVLAVVRCSSAFSWWASEIEIRCRSNQRTSPACSGLFSYAWAWKGDCLRS